MPYSLISSFYPNTYPNQSKHQTSSGQQLHRFSTTALFPFYLVIPKNAWKTTTTHKTQDWNRNKTKTAKGHTNNKQSQTFADTFRFCDQHVKKCLEFRCKNARVNKKILIFYIYIQGTPPQFFLFIIVCLQFFSYFSCTRDNSKASQSNDVVVYITITKSYLFKPHYCSPFLYAFYWNV